MLELKLDADEKLLSEDVDVPSGPSMYDEDDDEDELAELNVVDEAELVLLDEDE